MKTITLDATIENIEAVTDFVGAELDAIGCPVRQRMQINVAIDELVSNVARYAYAPGKGCITVQFGFDEESKTITLTFIDEGIPYDPLKRADPDTTLAAADRKIGGLGIFLVRKTMDAMAYRRENQKNILSITKKI